MTVTRTSSGRVEVGGLEVAEEDVGPFGEVGDGVDQGFVFAPAGVGDFAGYVVEGFADLLAAEFYVGQDVLAFQLGEVAAGRGSRRVRRRMRTRWP